MDTKTCNKCDETKPVDAFAKRSASRDGLAYKCKQCAIEYANRYRVEVLGRTPMSEIRKELPKVRECRKCGKTTDRFNGRRRVCNPCRAKQRDMDAKDAYERSPERRAKVYSKNKNRQASKMQRTPLWADRVEIDYVYHAAQVIKDVYGTTWHVDHIVPLQGENVSGLHVQNNLQLLSPEANVSKSNKFEVM